MAVEHGKHVEVEKAVWSRWGRLAGRHEKGGHSEAKRKGLETPETNPFQILNSSGTPTRWSKSFEHVSTSLLLAIPAYEKTLVRQCQISMKYRAFLQSELIQMCEGAHKLGLWDYLLRQSLHHINLKFVNKTSVLPSSRSHAFLTLTYMARKTCHVYKFLQTPDEFLPCPPPLTLVSLQTMFCCYPLRFNWIHEFIPSARFLVFVHALPIHDFGSLYVSKLPFLFFHTLQWGPWHRHSLAEHNLREVESTHSKIWLDDPVLHDGRIVLSPENI